VGQRVSFLVLLALPLTVKEKSTPLKRRSYTCRQFLLLLGFAAFIKEKKSIFEFACKI
jgi:hypothetical protein